MTKAIMKAADRHLFESLKNEVSNLHLYWQVYRQLYAKNNERIDLLNESGSIVFRLLQGLILDEVTLALCRLTDPVKSAGKSTHGLPRLVARLDGRSYSALKSEMQSRLATLGNQVAVFRMRRNKAIAHSDLGTTLKVSKTVVPGVSRRNVEVALRTIRELMNLYEQQFYGGTTMYEEVFLPLKSDPKCLVENLKRSVAFRELERAGLVERRLWTEGQYKDA